MILLLQKVSAGITWWYPDGGWIVCRLQDSFTPIHGTLARTAKKLGSVSPLLLHVVSWLLHHGRWTSYIVAQGPRMSVSRVPGMSYQAPYALAWGVPECHICFLDQFLLVKKVTEAS